MFTLASSLVSLPFASKKTRTVILNTVEEEAGSSTNNFNEEHHHGKSIACSLQDGFLLTIHDCLLARTAPNPIDESFHSSDFKDELIQPPDC
jgi:hypothetical protein